MMSCRHCGTANESDAEKCRRCGRTLHTEAIQGKIACVNHANREAISTCNGCGNRLCDLCAFDVNGVDFCRTCAPEGAVAAGYEEDYERIPVINKAEAERAMPGPRTTAMVIDMVILVVVAFVIYLVLGLVTQAWRPAFHPTENWGMFLVYWFLVLLAWVLYHAVQLTMTGQTVGKRLCNIIVLTNEGTILNFGQALNRTLKQLVVAIPFGAGWWWSYLNIDSETWHDKWAGTYAYRYADTT
jgi:uncharacterized RDD family membrane protein YckC